MQIEIAQGMDAVEMCKSFSRVNGILVSFFLSIHIAVFVHSFFLALPLSTFHALLSFCWEHFSFAIFDGAFFIVCLLTKCCAWHIHFAFFVLA